MRFAVELSPRAASFLDRLSDSDEKLYRIMVDHLRKLPDVYRSDSFLKGSQYQNVRKHRVGDYRILYRVERQKLVILVIAIGHRREIYD